MTYSTQGRQSVTLPQGIRFPMRPASLNAFVLVCHGWRSPHRTVDPRPSASAGWLWPLFRSTRPLERGRTVVLMGQW